MSEAPDPAAELRRLVDGYQVTQALHVAAELGIAELLAGGARGSDELAAETGTHAPSLYRLLRALASIGVFEELEGRRFAATALSECLRTDAAHSLRGWAAFVGRAPNWRAWGSLLHSVRTGESAFLHVHGQSVWEYRAERPDESANFDDAMTALTRYVDRSVIDAYDFGRFATVVDVGGGRGAFVAALLRAHPRLQGILFDQAHVVAGAGEVLAEAGVADRCRIVDGSFFEGVPGGADAYVLKAIVHDWPDEEAVEILRACRRAAPEQAAVLVVERELGPPNAGPAAKFADLNMLVAPGGRERSLEEYAALFDAAGLRLVGATPAGGGLAVIEARAGG